MLILGITGGMDRVHETEFARYNKDIHDSAAVLLDDGTVVAAIEEERLDRIKHTNKFPAGAIRFCLEHHGVKLADIDWIGMTNREETITRYVTWMHFTLRQNLALLGAADWLQKQLHEEFGKSVPREKIAFVGHHLAHAMSAFACSGYDRSLVVTLDGLGDAESGTVRLADRKQGLRLLREYTMDQSLGVFYQRVGFYLGFRAFDEFKVMGLAPYGDASRYRRFFEAAYTILPDGDYKSDFTKLFPLLSELPPRRPQEPITQPYMDVAAALQEMIEKIAFAVLRHYRRQTREPCLALAGGVAHNCTLNGRLLSSGLFDRIYVQPAAHDGGTALGAALYMHAETARDYGSNADRRHVYWGRPVPTVPEQADMDQWADFVSVQRFADSNELIRKVARQLANNSVIGWVQGRSEYGPRALGNRSILADPRPPENKERINAMVKKREAFRPFAPAVLEEALHDYFDVPAGVADLSFMTFAVPVRKEMRDTLGAVTHVDGTARIQTVSRQTNELFWSLIAAFRDETGVPVLLNTSFNNNAEPIVDSVEDAIVCFLTTGLDHLVIGNGLISRRSIDWTAYLQLTVALQGWVVLNLTRRVAADGRLTTLHTVAHQPSMPASWVEREVVVSAETHRVLLRADGRQRLADLLCQAGLTGEAAQKAVVGEIERLWTGRLIRLVPPDRVTLNNSPGAFA